MSQEDGPINNAPSDEAQDHRPHAQADTDSNRTTDSRTCTKRPRNNNTSMNLEPPMSDINLNDPSADQNDFNASKQSPLQLPHRSVVGHANGEVDGDKTPEAIIDTTTTSTSTSTSTISAGKVDAENPDSGMTASIRMVPFAVM
jgi:hypothetical protein